MEKDVEQAFTKMQEGIDKLATMVADGFHAVDKRFEQVDKRFEQVDKRFDLLESEIRELRNEVRSIRAELERMPDSVEATYGRTMNDLLDRIIVIEKKLGIS
jgi:regulator of replication initiation timing